MAPLEHHQEDRLEAGLLTSTEEEKKIGLKVPGAQEYTQPTQPVPARKMTALRRVLLVIVVGFVLGLGVATARPNLAICGSKHHNSKTDLANEHGTKTDLSKAIQVASPDVLHRLLHAYFPERYQHGVYASDRDAIDAIHEDDPSVASALVKIAKRQDTNTTTDTVSPPTTSLPASTSVAPPTTSNPPSTTPTSTPATSSEPKTSETTNASPSTSPSTSAPETTSATPSSTTSSAQQTITSGTKTTSTPVPHTFTTTLPDGGTTTLTSTSWVAVVPTGSSDTSKNPGLQNAASLPRAEMVMPAAIGLLVGAVLMA